jgi:hypothetical protein
VPDDATVTIMGAEVQVIVYYPESNTLTLDETLDPHEGAKIVTSTLGALLDDDCGLLSTPEEEERAEALAPMLLRRMTGDSRD